MVVAASAVVLWMGCGGEDVFRHANSLQVEDRARDPFALGTALTADGAVPRDSAGAQFTRGGEVYLSINVTGASSGQSIEVSWVGPNGGVIRRDSIEVPRGSQYAAFSSGETEAWRPGAHRAVVMINGRKVSERAFEIL